MAAVLVPQVLFQRDSVDLHLELTQLCVNLGCISTGNPLIISASGTIEYRPFVM